MGAARARPLRSVAVATGAGEVADRARFANLCAVAAAAGEVADTPLAGLLAVTADALARTVAARLLTIALGTGRTASAAGSDAAENEQ